MERTHGSSTPNSRSTRGNSMVSPEKRIGYGVALANLALQPTSAATALAAERLIRWAEACAPF